jgi:hypothetical protein
MNVRNAVSLLLATAVVCGLVWALHSLAHTRSWESFAVICALMFIVVCDGPADRRQRIGESWRLGDGGSRRNLALHHGPVRRARHYPDRWPISFSGAWRPASTSSTNWMAVQIFPKTSMRGSSAQPAPDCISSTERLASRWAKQRSKAATEPAALTTRTLSTDHSRAWQLSISDFR